MPFIISSRTTTYKIKQELVQRKRKSNCKNRYYKTVPVYLLVWGQDLTSFALWKLSALSSLGPPGCSPMMRKNKCISKTTMYSVFPLTNLSEESANQNQNRWTKQRIIDIIRDLIWRAIWEVMPEALKPPLSKNSEREAKIICHSGMYVWFMTKGRQCQRAWIAETVTAMSLVQWSHSNGSQFGASSTQNSRTFYGNVLFTPFLGCLECK